MTHAAGRRAVGEAATVLAVGLVCAAIGAIFVLAAVADASDERAVGRTYVDGFENASGVDLVLASGDGQSYAALARDPSLSRPGMFPTVEEAAYRASRPVLGYAAWGLSLGRGDWVPGALVAITIIGAGVAGAASAALLAHRGALPWLGIGAVVLPGSLSAFGWLLPEVLAFGLAAAGVAVWERGRRGVVPLALFAAAGLTREVLLLVPLVLFIQTIRHRGVRAALPLTWPFVVWLTWAAVVRIRIGFWPFEWHADTRAELPFSGLVRGISRWNELGMNVVANVLALTLLVALIAALVMVSRRDHLRWIALSFLIVPPFFWAEMWHRWQDFTRVLLPLTAFGAIALLGAVSSRSQGKEPATSG